MATEKAIRNSKQKTAILDVLAKTDSHPTADWVYQKVSRKIPNISLGTVYRNLANLAKDGQISRMEVGDGIDRFDYTVHPHDHFYCAECGSLYDVELSYDEDLDELAEKTGCGKIERHNLIFQGTCTKCLNSKKNDFIIL